MYERSGTLMKRKFREYLIPTILMSIAGVTANVADSIIVGNLLNEAALSAVGLVLPIIYIVNALFMLFAVGGVTCVSVARGRRETDNANSIFTLTFIFGISVMLIFTVALLLFMHPVTSALAQGNHELAEMTRAYLIPMAFIGPIIMIIIGMAYFVRIDNRPQTAAHIIIVSNLINLILTYAFIKFLGWGMMGAGLATVLGYSAGAFILLPYFFSKQRTLRFVKPRAGDLAHIPRVISVGSPKALMQLLSFLRILTLNVLIIGVFGPMGMAAMTVCINTLMITSMFINGTNDTLLPIVGTLYGEKDYPGIRFTTHTGFKFMMTGCVVLTVIFLIVPAKVGSIFGVHSPEGVAMTESALRMYALCLPLYGVNTLLQNFYQTTGRVKLALFTVFLNTFGFVALFALIFARWSGNLIWLAFVLAEGATLLVTLGIWARIRKKENTRGILLLRREETKSKALDLSIPATIEAATGLSKQIMQFCRDNGTDESSALRLGIAVEEMAANTALYGHKKGNGMIDVLVRVTHEELILRLRDNGTPFDPTKYRSDEKIEFATNGIEVVRRLAQNISYSRQLGFNVCIITIPQTALKEN
jgi:Na+-driven multidrug efflux pump/anti-sigma regulatory factor (Ser/Thr protein kinase)